MCQFSVNISSLPISAIYVQMVQKNNIHRHILSYKKGYKYSKMFIIIESR